MTYEPILGGWTLKVQALKPNEPVRLSCGGEDIVRLWADEEGTHACVWTRWEGAMKRFGSDEMLEFRLDAPGQSETLRLEWRESCLRLYADDVLADEEWPLGFPAYGAIWTLEGHAAALLTAVDEFEPDQAVSFEGSAQYFTLPGHNTAIGDCMPFEFGGEYHLFCLFDRRHHRSKKGLGAHQWAHLSTKDLRHWTQHPIALGIDAQWEGSICTGSMIEKDGRVYAFYAVRMSDGSPARLTWAESEDCIHFVKSGRYFELKAPYEPTSARDPKVWLGEDGLYHMLVTTSLPEIGLRDGCLAHLTSENLMDWTQLEPMLVPGLDDQPECSDYFKLGELYYLVFSNHGTARYLVSEKPFGPWRRLREDILDCAECRVPKTAMLGGRRLVTGWATDGPWAGRLVTHELICRADGTLGSRFIEEIVPERVCEIVPDTGRLSASDGSDSMPLAETGEAFQMKLCLHPQDENMAYGLDIRGGDDRIRLEMDAAYETVMLMRGKTHINSVSRAMTLTRAAWCRAPFDVEVILCDGIVEFQLPDDHVMLTGHTLCPPYEISVYARGALAVEPHQGKH